MGGMIVSLELLEVWNTNQDYTNGTASRERSQRLVLALKGTASPSRRGLQQGVGKQLVQGGCEFRKACSSDIKPCPMSVPQRYFITGPKVQGHSKTGGETLFSRAKLSGYLDSVLAQGHVRGESLSNSDRGWKVPTMMNAALPSRGKRQQIIWIPLCSSRSEEAHV